MGVVAPDCALDESCSAGTQLLLRRCLRPH
jgi:hypothetical protein